MYYFGIKLVQYNEYFIGTVDIDSMVLLHQGTSSHNAGYAPMRFYLFCG